MKADKLFRKSILLAGLFMLTAVGAIAEIKPVNAQQQILAVKGPNLVSKIFSMPGNGCCWNANNPSPLDSVITAFFDPDIYIENKGTVASGPGKLTVEWFDLLTCSNIKAEVNVPAIQPGQWTAVTTGHVFYIARKSAGIKLTLVYSNQFGAKLSYTRVAKNCPDSY